MIARDYKAVRTELIRCLTDLVASLQVEVRKPHTFRFVSQVQAGAVERGVYKHQSSGAPVSEKPLFGESELRAAAYNQAAALAELQTFIKLSKVVIFELGEAAVTEFGTSSVVVPLTLTRGLIERVALCASLVDSLKSIPEDPGPPTNPMEAVHDASPAIHRAIYGTKLDWPKLAEVDLRKADAASMQYTQRELRADLAARSVLTAIDKLNKRVAGARLAYEILCEFLHPNVGDLYASTVEMRYVPDQHGTRHFHRIIKVGEKNLSVQQADVAIRANVLEICCDIVRFAPTLFTELDPVLDIIRKRTRRFAHELYWSRQLRFRKDDACPCLSGLSARLCVAKDKPTGRERRTRH